MTHARFKGSAQRLLHTVMPRHAGSSGSGSGAPQPVALNSAASQRAALSGHLQTLVEDVKQFGRIPKRKKGTSEQERAENKLAKRLSDHRDSIPKDVMLELQALEGASSSESRAGTLSA